MKTKHALIISLLITLLIASNYHLFSSLNQQEKETTIVSYVIDGDTIILQDGRTIRLLNINAPEKNTFHFQESHNFLKQIENQTVQIDITSSDRYERALARIYTPEYLNLKIVEQGFASKFLVEKSELKQFAKAENQAIESERGIWKKSSHYDCFTSQINKKREFLVLTNNCQPINIKDWVIKDESRKNYKFPKITLDTINLHTTNGTDNSTDLFWNSKSNIWNNDRDSLYLFDSQGNIAHYNSYGY